MTDYETGAKAVALGPLASAMSKAAERALERKARQRIEIFREIPENFDRRPGREYRFWLVQDADLALLGDHAVT